MTDHTRDEIARLIHDTYTQGRSPSAIDMDDAERTADALLAAGLVVPAGLTAEKLLDLEEDLSCARDALVAGRSVQHSIVAMARVVGLVNRQLRAWADALGVPEAKTER